MEKGTESVFYYLSDIFKWKEGCKVPGHEGRSVQDLNDLIGSDSHSKLATSSSKSGTSKVAAPKKAKGKKRKWAAPATPHAPAKKATRALGLKGHKALPSPSPKRSPDPSEPRADISDPTAPIDIVLDRELTSMAEGKSSVPMEVTGAEEEVEAVRVSEAPKSIEVREALVELVVIEEDGASGTEEGAPEQQLMAALSSEILEAVPVTVEEAGAVGEPIVEVIAVEDTGKEGDGEGVESVEVEMVVQEEGTQGEIAALREEASMVQPKIEAVTPGEEASLVAGTVVVIAEGAATTPEHERTEPEVDS
ncbi:chromo domain-containing protein cec-1-like [Amborella trichopoda]|uniref:chromo domain-containing protein cec-1-like n=1 Tax=Amborella trichopoda TaxID=13333 RepID=UPI0005D37EE1|nr:chromo domain-containing protein cec-1-like [Amborella trichopoda]|eukprot:XP_011620330.1 chromo domain-containing protein cec-1-like [Amborella trichopoda]